MYRVKEALQQTYSFQLGDSAEQLSRSTWKDFFDQMDKAIAGSMDWTLVLKDPMANSFIAPRGLGDDSKDAQLNIEDYERSAEEDAEYGIDHLIAHGTGMEGELEGLHLNSID